VIRGDRSSADRLTALVGKLGIVEARRGPTAHSGSIYVMIEQPSLRCHRSADSTWCAATHDPSRPSLRGNPRLGHERLEHRRRLLVVTGRGLDPVHQSRAARLALCCGGRAALERLPLPERVGLLQAAPPVLAILSIGAITCRARSQSRVARSAIACDAEAEGRSALDGDLVPAQDWNVGRMAVPA
jgi:hypothetical protein